MIFVDSNIPMYLVGADDGLRVAAERLLSQAASAEEKLVTDAEVLQEILHRYTAINRRKAIQPAFDAILGLADEVFAITAQDVERAKAIVLSRERLSARDGLHAAVMEREGVTRIMTFDGGFDELPGITRVGS